MSQKLVDEISYNTGNGEIQFSISVELSTRSTHSDGPEIQTASLGIPDNESLKDAEKDMDELARNSISHWED